MKVVIISDCSRIDRHTIGRVLARWPGTTVLRPNEPSTSFTRRVVRSARSPVISTRRRYHRAADRRRLRSLRHVLTDVVAMSTVAPEPISVAELNRPAGIERIGGLHPDLLLLCGAPLLRDGLLAVPSIGTVNVHFGIAPQYRGQDTLFHALRRRDYDHVGLTIHGVDRGVDSGPVIVQANPALEPSDDEASLFAKCAALAAFLLVEAMEAVEERGAIPGRPQTEPGVLYRADDRRVVRHDVAEAVGRLVLRQRPPRRPERITRYYDRSMGAPEP